jgi:hypothetical protein
MWRLCNPGQMCIVLHIFGFAVVIPLLLRFKLPRLEMLLEPKRVPSPPGAARVEAVVRAVDAVLRTGKPLLRSGCLTRGLTLYYFLRRTGVDVTLCFGIGDVKGEFVGHCWLAKGGEPFMEARDPRPLFTEVYCVPAQSRAQEPGCQRIEGAH